MSIMGRPCHSIGIDEAQIMEMTYHELFPYLVIGISLKMYYLRYTLMLVWLRPVVTNPILLVQIYSSLLTTIGVLQQANFIT